jgi:hypothetical protein
MVDDVRGVTTEIQYTHGVYLTNTNPTFFSPNVRDFVLGRGIS